MTFKLDDRLAADTVPVAEWALCRVLLMKDANYPWLILVPALPDLREIHDLDAAGRGLLVEEIARASRALDAALAFARSAQAEDLYCFHAYSVPENYEVTGQSYQDFSAFLLRQASEAYARSIQGINPGNIDLIPVFEQSGDLSSAIQNFANREKIDLVIVGARGAGSGIVDALGSTTETLLQTMALPLLSIKQKGESGQVLDLLFKK